MRIIKKLLEDNKKSWHTKLKYALWADRISTKRAIGMSLFQLVYGAEVIFPTSLGIPVMKLLWDPLNEPNPIQRRINQIIELNEVMDKAYDKVQIHQEKMKNTFDRRVKEDVFQVNDLVLKWDSPHEDKGKHGKFNHLWVGPYLIEGGTVNGRFLKHY